MNNHEALDEYSRTYFPDAYATAQISSTDEQTEFYARMKACKAEDERAFDVRAITEDTGVALVSAIRTYGNLGPFRPLGTKDFKGVRLFDILLRPGQIACSSSVKPGDTSANLYGNWGVIIADGTVQQAFPYDATTAVVNGQARSKFMPRIAGMRPKEQMAQAIHSRNLYNEINVALRGIAGLYYCTDEDAPPSHDYLAPAFFDAVQPLAIPNYTLRRGEFYPLDTLDGIDPHANVQPIPLTDVMAQSITPSSKQIDYMVDYLTQVLTLAPRNAITSGYNRGAFAYEYHALLPNGKDSFIAQHERLARQPDNPSLQLYGAMALHAFAEAAQVAGDGQYAAQASMPARVALDYRQYKDYKSRILPTGNLAITSDDLRHYMAHETLPDYLADH